MKENTEEKDGKKIPITPVSQKPKPTIKVKGFWQQVGGDGVAHLSKSICDLPKTYSH